VLKASPVIGDTERDPPDGGVFEAKTMEARPSLEVDVYVTTTSIVIESEIVSSFLSSFNELRYLTFEIEDSETVHWYVSPLVVERVGVKAVNVYAPSLIYLAHDFVLEHDSSIGMMSASFIVMVTVLDLVSPEIVTARVISITSFSAK